VIWKFIDKAQGYIGPSIWVCYPHTTKWDAALVLATGWLSRTYPMTLVKAQEFVGVQGVLLAAAGCIPVDPRGGCQTLDRVLRHWARNRNRSLALSPEGRIEAVPYWRTGFYILSLVTGIPITYSWMDYQRRLAVREAPVWMTGDPARDLAMAQSLMKASHALYPSKVGPIRFREDWALDETRLERQRQLWATR
jgi:1-acyl-sn-glycerol-3-phosphate acyltransferase